MAVLLLLLSAAAAVVSGTATCAETGDDWSSFVLDPSISFTAHHKVVDETLHLRLEAMHAGWLGFGFGEPTSGHMKGSDMVTVSVTSAEVNVQDRYAVFAPTDDTGYGMPSLTALEDEHNDWSIVWGYENAGVTHVYVTRALNTTDTQDRAVGKGPVRITWAWGNGDTVLYHGPKRGASKITFVPDDDVNAARTTLPAHDGSWTFNFANYTVPSSRVTTYACQAFKFPVDGPDKHVVAIKPLLNPATAKYNHHAILHVCQDNGYWEDHLSPRPCSGGEGDLGDSPLGQTNSGCSSLMWSWALGLDLFVLPEKAGFLVGDSLLAASHIILEVHYDNPALTPGLTDDFGFEAYYVNTPREHDAAGMTLGDPTIRLAVPSESSLVGGLLGSFLNIAVGSLWPYESGNLPPGKEKQHRQATCPSECTSDLSEPITVFGSNLHAHTMAQKLYTEHYDANGNFLGVHDRMRIDFWDNGFQAMEELRDGDFVVNPGDSLQVHCYYNSAGRTQEVEFGFATQQEMCMQFIYYYPAQTRGADSKGNPLRFANCGMFAAVSELGPATLCGGLSQSGADVSEITEAVGVSFSNTPDFIIVQGQRDTGDGFYADPLRFGESPSASGAGMDSSTQRCFPDGAPPTLPPPASPLPSTTTVTMTFTLSGDASDYSKLQIATRVAHTLDGTSASDVTVTFISGSVVVRVEVAVPATQTAAGVSTSLRATFGSAASTEHALYLAPGTVLSTPEVSDHGEMSHVHATSDGDSKAYILGLGIGGVLFNMLVLVLLFRHLRNSFSKRQAAHAAQLKKQTVAPVHEMQSTLTSELQAAKSQAHVTKESDSASPRCLESAPPSPPSSPDVVDLRGPSQAKLSGSWMVLDIVDGEPGQPVR